MHNILKFFTPSSPPYVFWGDFLPPSPRSMDVLCVLSLHWSCKILSESLSVLSDANSRCRESAEKGAEKRVVASTKWRCISWAFSQWKGLRKEGTNTQGGLHTWRPHNFWICWPPPPLCPRNIYWLSTHLRHFRAYPTVRSSYMEAPNITNRRKLLHEGEWQKHRTLFSNSKSSSRERRAFWHEAFFVAPILTADWRSGRLSQSVSQSVPVQ